VRVDTVSDTLKIIVRDISDYRKVEDLGVKANLITIDPKSGISGDTKFTASYTICNSPAFTKPAINNNVWKYMIQYGQKDDMVTLSSDQCSGSIDFVLPPHKTGDKTYNVTFTFSLGENYY